MMKRIGRFLLVVLGVFALLGVIFSFLPDKGMVGFIKAYLTPVRMYGRVVDQKGNPVAGARVQLFIQSNPFGESGNRQERQTDADGRFILKGVMAFAVGVQVSKDGYASIDEINGRAGSGRLIEYGIGVSGKAHANPSNPAVFVLYDPGPMEPLVIQERNRYHTYVNGRPNLIGVNEQRGAERRLVELRLWSDWKDRLEGQSQKFSWRAEISVPGGGFVKRSDAFAFEAPLEGYVPVIQFDYPDTMVQKDWKARVRDQEYFVRFEDGTYGRIKLGIDGDSEKSGLIFESWWNPKSGSRNLATSQRITD